MTDERQAAEREATASTRETGFPAGFHWGAATAAYQIEGAVREDGRGESIWDRFSHTPGAIVDGSTGDDACDSYHRLDHDLDLLARLGLTAYRFSIAWPRIFPTGRGPLNEAGLAYYARLIDGLLARGIAPFATLYHWDLPQALEDRGGWLNRDTAGFFADFAAALGRRLGDRIAHWITLNEPHIVAYEGYLYGQKAPGKRDATLLAPVSHHLLLAHGRAVQALRAETPAATQIGLALNLTAIESATDRAEDVEAAALLDGLWHRWYLDPLYRASYPDDVQRALPLPPDLVRAGDLETIAGQTDFLGVNYYTRARVKAGVGPRPRILPPAGRRCTMGWELYPDGLEPILRRLRSDYQPARLYITENGVPVADTLTASGEVHDDARIEYLREHLQAARAAIAAGVPLAGYFVWSLLDNFEWQLGYTQRFGLAYTDYATQRRIPKDSARFYASLAATNGATLDTSRDDLTPPPRV